MYNPEHVFYPNAMNRFALGTKGKTLKYNPGRKLSLKLAPEAQCGNPNLVIHRSGLGAAVTAILAREVGEIPEGRSIDEAEAL
jgi:hypothetical protein